jgi:hypothetical protein
MSTDPHRPTTAGSTPDPPAGVTADAPSAQPAGSVAVSASGEGNELPFGIPPDRPEILVGAAFAGGLLAAIILKRFGGD